MNKLAIEKLRKTLSLASEFIKDENSYVFNSYVTESCCSIGSGLNNNIPIKKCKSNDIRAKAEQEASKLERQETCARLIKECLDYLVAIHKFEGEPVPDITEKVPF